MPRGENAQRGDDTTRSGPPLRLTAGLVTPNADCGARPRRTSRKTSGGERVIFVPFDARPASWAARTSACS